MSDALGVGPLLAERLRFLDTVGTLSDEEFEHGTTLCSQWAPRDVLAHLMTTGDLRPYLRNAVRIDRTNNELVGSLRRSPPSSPRWRSSPT